MSSLPPLGSLVELDELDREILEARVLAQLKKRQTEALRRAVETPDIVDDIQSTFWLRDKVNIHTKDFSRASKIILSDVQKRILRKVFTINPKTGRFPYRTIIYSAPKKSGKSTIGSAIACYFAKNIEYPNNIYILANDREQSAGRVFDFAVPTLISYGGIKDGKYKYVLPNGSVVQALTSNASKEAGGTYGLTIWDELWAYKSDLARLLWDEMMPIDTRENSIRLVVSYAGFEDSSDLLFEHYTKVFTDTTETELQEGARPVEELIDITTTNSKGEIIPCCYEVPRMAMFYYNDHERRMTWQRGERGKALEEETAETLTPVNVYRLLQNRWQMTENRFLEPEWLETSFDERKLTPDLQALVDAKFPIDVTKTSGVPDVSFLEMRRDYIEQLKFENFAQLLTFPMVRPMTFAIDAAQRNDCTALIGMYDYLDYFCTGYSQAWYPFGQNIDLDMTIGKEIVRLFRLGLIARREPMSNEKALVESERLTCIDVWFDPTQMHTTAMNLRRDHRILIAEFNQGAERERADTFLQQKYQDGKVWNKVFDNLQDHLEAARGEQQLNANQNLVRIVKASGKFAKPIDLAVAQSMAVWRRSKRPKSFEVVGMPQGRSKGWQKPPRSRRNFGR